ncbi:ead/Ea22-like family protein [Escherichia coli]|nr:ead/Ea22-like family protein [Escherichia coli]EFD5251654.1 ead/Ea22-like family protein [Escherichia coli]EIX8981427.1 ead/Ea22-like family protein [Escherichia coli]ELC6205815.1 ead/Ea22-like family protein [Escherichia coli]EMD3258774.1 ead/Ea22-like family protein [Escherichia coli]MBW4286482.1 ead/Ea22-like family protein [Escherichia coli]
MSNIDKQSLRQTAEKAQEHGVFNMDIHSQTVLALLDELEAKDQRIAELEAREVVLPQRYSMLHRVDFDEPYHTEMVYKQHQVLEALHDAEVNVAADAKGAAS